MSDKIRKEFEAWLLNTSDNKEFIRDYINTNAPAIKLYYGIWQAAYKASRHEELVEMVKHLKKEAMEAADKFHIMHCNINENAADKYFVPYKSLCKEWSERQLKASKQAQELLKSIGK